MGTTSGNAPAMRLVAIDDDPKNLKFVNFILAESGLEIHTESDAQAGLELIHKLRPQIVLMDLIMPGVQGMELLQKIVEFDPGIDVILMTGYYSTESAVEAIQKGAADYFPKPFSPEKLRQRIALIVEDAKRRQRSSRLDNELLENFQFQGIIGRSPLMLDLFSKIQRIAPHFRSVLVTGPTGSGKELVARALHQLSGSEKRFVAVNCSSITETLAESELFGHVKGAFTGANQDKVGRFRVCQRRNGDAGRDWRNAFGHAIEVAAGPAKPRSSARGLSGDHQGGRARGGRDAPRSAGDVSPG